MRHMRAGLVLAVLAIAAAQAAGSAGSAPKPPRELLYANEGNNLRRFDIDSIDEPVLIEQMLVTRASASEDPGGPFDPQSRFRDINGMVCPLPDGSGRFVAGEDTGQPHPPAGWGVFDPGGTQIGKLTPTYQNVFPEPFGCAFDAQGRLFTTDIGDQGVAGGNGQLLVWFPPFDRFPGPPGAYPATDERSASFCVIAHDIGNASGVAVDRLGRVYVASPSNLYIRRFLPPFPESVADCTGSDPQGSPKADVAVEIFAAADFIRRMVTFTGLAIRGDRVYAASIITGTIGEYDFDGNLLRLVLDPPERNIPFATGTPQGLTFDSRGNLYYADLDLVGVFPNVGPGPNGKVWRIRFDPETGDPLPPGLVRQGLRFPDGLGVLRGDLEPREWRTYGGSYERRFFEPRESVISWDNVDELAVKWRFPTGAIITATPSVARVRLPGASRREPLVYFQAWDGFVYAVRLADGSEVWRFATDPQPGASYPYTASVDVSRVDGEDRVFVAAGETMYALDAATGGEIWRFVAGTGCRDAQGSPPGLCSFSGERNEIETSAAVARGLVLFGMDVNDVDVGKGGFYAVDAGDGRLRWFFDLESGQTCRPLEEDAVRRYDPYHSEQELGLPPGFLATRPGCAHPRTRNGCGNVWSSPAVDLGRGLAFFASSNCDTDDDPSTNKPAPPMPPYDEALVALHLDGTPAWRWRPREVDNADFAFGATPNLFRITRNGRRIDVVGIGNKDGTYTVLDRDGRNEENGVRWHDVNASTLLPYWRTQVVAGGAAGGIIGSASVDVERGRVSFATAPGTNPFTPQQPTLHALVADTGEIAWDNGAAFADSSFAPTSGIPGVVFQGSVLAPVLRAHKTQDDDGSRVLALTLNAIPFGSAVASGATVVDGSVIVGAGIGARSSSPSGASDQTSRFPTDVVALCVPGTPGCESSRCGLGFELALALPLWARLRRRAGRTAAR